MRTILVDDNPMEKLRKGQDLESISDVRFLKQFSKPEEALKYAEKNQVELAILDIQMPHMNGSELSRKLRNINPDMAIIFLTPNGKFAADAMRNQASAYVLKTYSVENLQYAVQTAKSVAAKKKRRVFARTFGNFDLFVDGRAILFKSAKAKELLAFLVDRQGGTVSTGQIIATLWEDRPNDEATQNLCSKVTKALQEELNHHEIGDILLQARGVKSVDIDKFDCDLYQMLNGEEQAVQKYLGEYMSEYAWAEERAAALQKYL